jgi:hypothetical protein
LTRCIVEALKRAVNRWLPFALTLQRFNASTLQPFDGLVQRPSFHSANRQRFTVQAV